MEQRKRRFNKVGKSTPAHGRFKKTNKRWKKTRGNAVISTYGFKCDIERENNKWNGQNAYSRSIGLNAYKNRTQTKENHSISRFTGWKEKIIEAFCSFIDLNTFFVDGKYYNGWRWKIIMRPPICIYWRIPQLSLFVFVLLPFCLFPPVHLDQW